eukprot:3469636-Amphidinium_carterae.1
MYEHSKDSQALKEVFTVKNDTLQPETVYVYSTWNKLPSWSPLAAHIKYVEKQRSVYTHGSGSQDAAQFCIWRPDGLVGMVCKKCIRGQEVTVKEILHTGRKNWRFW